MRNVPCEVEQKESREDSEKKVKNDGMPLSLCFVSFTGASFVVLEKQQEVSLLWNFCVHDKNRNVESYGDSDFPWVVIRAIQTDASCRSGKVE